MQNIIDFIGLELWILVFLIASLSLRSTLQSTISTLGKRSIRYQDIVPLIIIPAISLTVYITTSSTLTTVGILLHIAFGFLSGASILIYGMTWKTRAVYLATLFVSIIWICKAYLGSVPSHNLIIILSTVWLAPLFVCLNFINSRRLLIIGALWMVGDMFLVWYSAFSSIIQKTASSNSFALSLVSGNMSIGTGDILYAGLALSVLKRRGYQRLAILAFALSDLILSALYNYLGMQGSFPLLVLWVPIGTILIILDHYKVNL